MRGSDRLGGRDRGVTAVIGFILIFGILVISFSLYQAKVVPQQNADVEFEQYQGVQEQMVDLRNTVVSMYDSTSSESTAVDLGVRYPSRTVFVNPGPASARLQTEGTDNPDISVTIQNAKAIDSEGAGETASFWNGTERVYETGSIEYRPDYNRFQGAQRIVYEHGLIYSQVEAGAGSVPLTQQPLIQDDRISFVALDGSLQEGGTGTMSVDFEPISTRSEVVEVNNAGGPITLEFASKMDVSVWNDTFEDQLIGNGGHVESVEFSRDGPDGFDIIAVTLESDQRYNLELAKIGVGTETAETTEQYLTTVEGANAVVQSGSTQRLTVEARDRFNTPQSGVQVEADPNGGEFLNSTNVTGSDGRATFLYEAETAGTHRVNFTIDSGYTPDDSHDPSTATNVSMRVTVPAISGGGGSGSGGDGGFSVNWEDSSSSAGVSSGDPYQYNASKNNPLELTMFTDPSVDGAPVDYAITNRSRATLSTYEGKTEADGTGSTTLRPKENGTVTVYTYSGGDTDELELEITDVERTIPTRAGSIVYQNPSNSELSVLEANNTETRSVGPNDVNGIGLTRETLTKPIPYVKSNSLKITNTDGETKTLVDGTDDATPNPKEGLISTGTWKGSDPSVFYAGFDDGKLYRVSETGPPEEVLDPQKKDNLDSSIRSVLDIGDIDDDDDDELVFATENPSIEYLNQNGNVETVTSNIGSNNGLGVGELVEIDGTVWALHVSGGNSITLSTDDESQTITSGGASKSPLTAADVDEDGDEEIVFVGTNSEIQYVDAPAGSQVTKQLVDSNGDAIEAKPGIGVASADSSDSGTSKGSDIPFGTVAFNDEDGDGQYDDDETAYTDSELNFNNKAQDIVVERDVIKGAETSDKIEIGANTVTVRDDVKIRTANGKGISITAESDVNLSGATLIAEGDNGALKKITAGNGGSGDINATDTVFIYGKEAVLEADGGTLSVNDNGGGKANGGTFIEDTDGNAGTIKLSKGDSDGTPERGNID